MSDSPSLSDWSSELHQLVGASIFTEGNDVPLAQEAGVSRALEILRDARRRGGNIYLVGNGGSAAIASHAANDFVNVCNLRALTLTDPALLTCMANDYGYAHVFSEQLSRHARQDDVLIAISSSGRSPNILNAVSVVRELGGLTMTLSGFAADNPLRGLGDLNLYLPRADYGLVEIGHQFILHHLANVLHREGIPAHAQ